jgi:hypothetical protein
MPIEGQWNYVSAVSSGAIDIRANEGGYWWPYGGDATIYGVLKARETIDIAASDYTIYLGGDFIKARGDITLHNNTVMFGSGDQRIDSLFGKLTAYGDIDKTVWGDLNLAGQNGIYLAGDVFTDWGNLVFEDFVIANGCGNQIFDADGYGKRLIATDTITKTSCGNLKLDGGWDAGYEIYLMDDVDVQHGDLILGSFFGRDDTLAWPDVTLSAYDDIKVYGDLMGLGNLSLLASDDTIYLWGDTYSYGNLLLGANTKMKGWFDQYIEAQGSITADGYIRKLNYNECFGWSRGSLYMRAGGDISLAGDVIAAFCCPGKCFSAGGGVSIISENGKIYSPDSDGMLNVKIVGRSIDPWNIGVDLPYGPGKAAIVIMSAEDLEFGPDSYLLACGKYFNDGSVDDRAGIDFVDTEGTRIPSPDGPLRDEGDPFDLAIYVASTGGDVHLGGPVTIRSKQWNPYEPDGFSIEVFREGYWTCEPIGAMVADSLVNVTFGQPFIDSLEGGDVGDRLELVSRVSEWLDDAIGRLPFPSEFILPDGYNYVLRGAGAYGEGAWVLENPGDDPPLTQEAGQTPEEQEFGEGGCPVLMQWLADELGMSEEDIQVFVANTFALATDIQPCEACARLKDAANILADESGQQVAALAQVVNEFITPAAPITDEQMTLIASAFANNIDADNYYAYAGAYIDAVVQYVGILNSEMGIAAEDALALFTEKYAPTDNAAANAYIQARLAQMGG